MRGDDMTWIFHKAQDVFDQYQDAWDELNKTIDNHVLLDAKFWGTLVQLFADENTLLGISENSQYPGMILVKSTGIGRWSTFQPAQAPIGPILLGNPDDIEGQIRTLLQSLPGYAIGLGITQQDPSFGHVNSVRASQTIEIQDYIQTARIRVEGGFNEYWKTRGSDLKVNMRKRLRRLEREGIRVSLEAYQSPSNVTQCIQHYGELEQLGWKGRGGTAVTAENAQGAFYRNMLEHACRKQEGLIYVLRFNEKTVAQKICLRRNGMVIFLKMAYDETYRRLSPGYILQYMILQRLFEEKQVQGVETYGRVNEGWTNKWTDDFRMMYHLNYFRHVWVRHAKVFVRRFRQKEGLVPSDVEQKTVHSAGVRSGDASIQSNGTVSGVSTSAIGHGNGHGSRIRAPRAREWEIVNAREYFTKYQAQWDELNKRLDNHLLLDSKFVGPLVQYFSTSRTKLAISKDSAYPGMVLLEGIGNGFWQTFQPSQAPIGLIALANKDNLEKQVQGLMASLPGVALGLSITQQDPDYSVFAPFSQFPHLEFVEYITTPRMTLFKSFDEYWKSRGKDLVNNLARRKKRLDENGVQISMSTIRDPEYISPGIQVYGQLEESGWKGLQGTAVSIHNDQGRFYRDMLKNFCVQEEGVIYQLLMDGKPIASDLCIRRNGMFILLKTAYDEEYKKLSPSYLMREEILKRLYFRNSIKVLEFYGRARDWHSKWTEEMRTMSHINFYRHSLVEIGRNALKAGGMWTGKAKT